MSVAALVAARGGSERVRGKNTKPFADSTLVEIKIKQLMRLRAIDDVVLSSDDDEILGIGERLGCTVRRRPADLASSAAPMSEVYRFMATELAADTVVYANCTSPLVRDATINSVIEAFHSRAPQYDSVNTVSEVREFLLKDGVPLNYDPLNQPRSQDLPNVTYLNFAVSVLARATMIERKNVLGMSPMLYTLNQIEGIDIDTEFDFDVAEFSYIKHGGEAYLST